MSRSKYYILGLSSVKDISPTSSQPNRAAQSSPHHASSNEDPEQENHRDQQANDKAKRVHGNSISPTCKEGPLVEEKSRGRGGFHRRYFLWR